MKYDLYWVIFVAPVWVALENRDRQILTFSPPVPALGQVGETIDRCITYIGYGEYLPPY